MAEGHGSGSTHLRVNGKVSIERDLPAIAQITKSAASVPANIAEGKGRVTARDFANFVAIAKGSLMETETYVTLSTRLEYVSQVEVQPILDLITEISKMLTVLRSRLVGAT